MSIDYSKPIRITLADRLVYFGFLGLELVLRLFPMVFWCLYGRMIGWIAWAILPKYRRLVRRNMRIIFGGQKDSRELRYLVRENFQTIICNFVASAKAATMSDKALARHFTITGKEHIINSLEKTGNGVICVIAHMGNWELLARVRVRFPEVARFGSMYRELDNPLLEKLWLDRRQKSGCEMFGKKTSTFADSTKILRDNGMLGILCDQNAGNYGVITPYYGKLTSTTNLPALLQRRTKAAFHPVTTRTTGLGKWEVSFGPAIELKEEGKDLVDTTAKINSVLSETGRKSPADGFWLHNRWKQDVLVPRGEPVPRLETSYGRPTLPLRLLVSLPDAFDEALLFLPVMKAISNARFDAEWNVLCTEEQKVFWENELLVSHVVVKGNSLEDSLYRLNNASPVALDMAYLLDNDQHVYHILKKITGIVFRSLQGEHSFIKNRRNAISLPATPGPRFLDYGRFVSSAHIKPEVTAYLPALGDRNLPPGAPIVICPFSTLGRQEEWSEGFWIKLSKRRPAPLTLIALEKDAERAEQWARDLGITCYILSIPEMIQELKTARLLVAVDGAVPVLAAYAGTPTVTLFSQRAPERYCPPGDFHHCVKARSSEYWDDDFVDSLIETALDKLSR